MEFIVIKVPDLRNLPPISIGSLTAYQLTPSLRPGIIFTDEAAACEEATKKAEENPGELYMVMKPLVVFEAKKPEKVDMIVKQYNPAGELIVMKE